ncbi:WD40-repeat-containing domain protein [Syncephalis plumigaleata]|nr:WD40-repeat-containing domain protein [Syncephalis plumigaleata]
MTTPVGDRLTRSYNTPDSLDTPTRCNYQSVERTALCSIVDPNNKAKEAKTLLGDDLHTTGIPSSVINKRPVSTYARWLSKTAYPYQLGRSLLRREMYGLPHADLNGRLANAIGSYARDFISRIDDTVGFLDEGGKSMLPLYAAYSHNARNGKLLAVSNEIGQITILNTHYTFRETECQVKQWNAHKDSVFHFQWSHDDTCIATGAGDQMVKLWDVETSRLLGIFNGHVGTVKSVAFHPTEPSIFATSGRDGNVLMWDMRCMAVPSSDEFCHHRPANRILNAHARITESVGSRKRRRTLIDTNKSVSSVLFLRHKDHLIASAGASDGLIKCWDVRHHGSYSGKEIPTPTMKSEYSGIGKRPHDNSGTRLFATSTDNTIYQFDARVLGRSRANFTSEDYHCSNFYVSAALSPDNRFLITGSTNEYAYIWDIEAPNECQKPIKLRGHTGEVSRVNWSHCDPHELVTCSDDGTMRVWHTDRKLAHEHRVTGVLNDQYGTAIHS